MHKNFYPIPILAYDLPKVELSYIQTIKGGFEREAPLTHLYFGGVVPHVPSKKIGKAGQSKWLLLLKKTLCVHPTPLTN